MYNSKEALFDRLSICCRWRLKSSAHRGLKNWMTIDKSGPNTPGVQIFHFLIIGGDVN